MTPLRSKRVLKKFSGKKTRDLTINDKVVKRRHFVGWNVTTTFGINNKDILLMHRKYCRSNYFNSLITYDERQALKKKAYTPNLNNKTSLKYREQFYVQEEKKIDGFTESIMQE